MAERTEAEREAARLERERRRAGQPENPPPVAPPPVEPPPVQPPPPAASSPPAAPPPEPEPAPEEFDTDAEVAADGGETTDFDELAAGTKRVSALDRQQPRTRHVRHARRPKVRGRRHSWRGRIGGLLAVVVAGALVWFVYELFQPFHGDGHGRVTVTIPPHTSAGTVGDLLEHAGVIDSSFFFGLRATLAGDRSDLRSGTYHLKLDMPYSKVLDILTKPPPAVKTSELTLIEGRTRRQIDGLLRSQGVKGSYLAATRHSRLLDPRHYGAPRNTPSLEGFLFPSTYQLRDPVKLDTLVADQLNEFKKVFRHVNLAGARRAHLTPYDVLTIASMVEGEAENEHDRRAVASVIYNRLRDRMPLQIDATSCYVQPREPCRLTPAALNSPSPYNTRIHKGLPPTPIGNPGLASIEAAANPPRTDYLYFVVKPCGNGKMLFTGNYQQFLKDAAQYQQARAHRGGRSPASCR